MSEEIRKFGLQLVRCNNCGEEHVLDYGRTECPNCGSENLEVITGKKR